MIKLYDYYRSSTCYRLRIALNLKNIAYEAVNVDLLKGEQRSSEFLEINPQGAVPLLIDGRTKISQSLAIMAYLDYKQPEPELLFGSVEQQVYIRQMVLTVSCDMHPFGNPKVWKGYLMDELGHSQEEAMKWMRHWLHQGFEAYEYWLKTAGHMGQFTCGDQVSAADLCLIPQLYNARRFGLDVSAYPNCTKIEKNAIKLEAFVKAAPESHVAAPEDLETIHGVNSPLLAGQE